MKSQGLWLIPIVCVLAAIFLYLNELRHGHYSYYFNHPDALLQIIVIVFST